MILIIRISGQVEIPYFVEESLFRLRLRKKYSAVLMKESPKTEEILRKIRNYVAYGKIDDETLIKLIEKRGISVDKKKIDAKKVIELIEKKGIGEAGIKPFFRLHPPIGGIDSKIHFGKRKGVLGNNKEHINELVRRML